MKKTMELAGITASTVIGAGFATGREVRTYFTKYGNLSYIIIAGVAVLLYCGVLLLLKSETHGGKMPAVPYVYFGYVLMLAAIGQLVKDYTGLPVVTGIFAGTVASVLGLKAGFGRFVKFSGWLTPVVAVFLVLMLLPLQPGESNSIMVFQEVNPVSVFISASMFLGYNFLSAVVVIPEIKKEYSKRQKVIGAGIGILIPMVCIGIVNESFLERYVEIQNCEMPLMEAISTKGEQIFSITALSLLCSVFILSLCGSAVGLSRMLAPKHMEFKLGLIFVVMAIPLSLIGFGGLMNNIYPAFGFFGIALFIWMLLSSNLTAYGKKLILYKGEKQKKHEEN